MNSIPQRIFPRRTPYPSSVNIRQYSIRHVGEAIRHLTNDLPAGQPSVIGIACHAGESGVLEFISLSNTDTAFLIRLGSKSVVTNADFAALCHPRNDAEPTTCLVGFSMAKVAVQVSDATHLRVKGVDLSTLLSPNTWRPKTPLEIITNHVSPGVDKWGIVSLWHGNEQTIETDLCLQAWLAACVGTELQTKIFAATMVDTAFLNVSERQFLVDVIFQSMRLESLKPKEVANEFVTATPDRSGRVDVVNSRYKTRIRRSEHTRIIMKDISGNEYIGNAQAAKGKKTTIKVQGNMGKSQLASVTVIGRQEPTNPERARDELIHRLLINQTDLRRSPFIRAVWFPKWKSTTQDNEDCADDLGAQDPHFEAVVGTLNDSQKHVVSEMIFGQHIVVTHGPPGTGKTTTIAAASKIWDHLRKNVWIVAHSNVAVKNIAEALAKREVDFKLVVSKEFHHEWHEHIYKLVEKALIISDELPDNPVEIERMLRGSRIILCTLSMLSNPALQDNGTFDIVPVDKLVIDEASQISTYDFLHLFVKFQQTLGKVCFFGDPKQLPPYGKDNIPTMKTIFDVQHIPSQSFLDTQYRMPAAVGNFISTAVYSGRLKSARPLEDNTCLAFVNVDLPRGEEEKAGFSWKNTGEIQTIVHLVKNYYKDKKFTVITPYDAQRAAIQQALQSEKLPWESVYNIDSFQGNEDDYVLISVVRSQHPGFLSSLNRLNVMLTRFKKGMVIVSSQRFMKLGGSQTLLGGLSREWQSKCSGNTWIDWRDVAGRQANLPGSSGVHGANRNLAFAWGYQHPVSHTPGTVYPQPVPFWYQGASGGFDTSKLFPQRLRQPQNLNLQPRPSMVAQAPVKTISPSTSIVRSNATFATIAAAPPKPPSHDGFIQVKRGVAPRSYQQAFVSRSSHASSANKFSPLRGQQTAAPPQSRQRDSTVQKANNALFTNKFSPIQGRWNTGPPALSNVRKKSSHSYAF